MISLSYPGSRILSAEICLFKIFASLFCIRLSGIFVQIKLTQSSRATSTSKWDSLIRYGTQLIKLLINNKTSFILVEFYWKSNYYKNYHTIKHFVNCFLVRERDRHIPGPGQIKLDLNLNFKFYIWWQPVASNEVLFVREC